MKRVIVTGGSGKLGRAAVDELIAHGCETTILDGVAPREGKCPVTLLDLSDFGQTYEALTAIDWSGASMRSCISLRSRPPA
jgi:NAD(P)-dependent dehydrogenase (short-subunit alcohol dehydrogenase family)